MAIKANKKLSGFIYLSYTFILLHISYGLGYIEGILKFIILGQKPSVKRTLMSR
jgi:hypothetical protein